MPVGLLRADNNLPPWRPGLKEVISRAIILFLSDRCHRLMASLLLSNSYWKLPLRGFHFSFEFFLWNERILDCFISQVFDAIICDPPYGVRAGGRKSGGRKLLKGAVDPYTVPNDKRTDHIPSTAPYSLVECVHDLLDLAAKMLVINGRLVFFYPVLREGESPLTQYPEHPCFKLIAATEQILSSRYSRVLLTMVKVSAYTEEIKLAARIRHMEFRENHLKWLEDGNLHTAVFTPADSLPNASAEGKVKETKPKYRGKYV